MLYCNSKYRLFILNVFVVCFGLTVMGISASVIHQQEKFDRVLSNAYYAVSLTTLLSGIFLAVLGLVGCIGAIKESYCMLKLYTVVVGIMLIPGLAGGILLLTFTSKSTEVLRRSMNDAYKKYGEDGQEQLTDHLDDLQHEGQCCGISGYKDWAYFHYHNDTSVADGCCRKWTVGCGVDMLNNPNVTEMVWSKGCLNYVHAIVNARCIALAILLFILVGFQAVSVKWAGSLLYGGFHYEQII